MDGLCEEPGLQSYISAIKTTFSGGGTEQLWLCNKCSSAVIRTDGGKRATRRWQHQLEKVAQRNSGVLSSRRLDGRDAHAKLQVVCPHGGGCGLVPVGLVNVDRQGHEATIEEQMDLNCARTATISWKRPHCGCTTA